jgi:hypothetical protein
MEHVFKYFGKFILSLVFLASIGVLLKNPFIDHFGKCEARSGSVSLFDSNHLSKERLCSIMRPFAFYQLFQSEKFNCGLKFWFYLSIGMFILAITIGLFMKNSVTAGILSGMSALILSGVIILYSYQSRAAIALEHSDLKLFEKIEWEFDIPKWIALPYCDMVFHQ